MSNYNEKFEKIGVINYRKSKHANLFIIGSFILFALIGIIFVVLSGSISHNTLKGQWFLLGCFCYIILHEAIHLIFMKFFSKGKIHISIKFPTISVGSNGKFNKAQFMIVALAPVIILGVILILLILFSPKEYTFFLTILLILNFAGSGGDYLQVFEMHKYPNDTFLRIVAMKPLFIKRNKDVETLKFQFV